MVEMILDYLSALGVFGLLVGVFIEALGLPFPGGVMIVFAGVLCYHGKLNALHAFAAALGGYVLGSLVAFLLARRYGNKIFLRFRKFLPINQESFAKTQVWLDKSTGVFIVLGRFIPGVGNLTPYMAGLSNISLYKFLFYNFLFIVIWGGIFLTASVTLDGKMAAVMDFIRTKFLFVALGGIVVYFIYAFAREKVT